MEIQDKTWHEADLQKRTIGDKLADWVASSMGSWTFIIVQTIIVAIWIALNVIGFMHHWDAYPFILLNLLFSTQGAYAAPIIMMAQNRAADRDRIQARADYETNVRAKEEIEQLQESLARIENDKLDKIITMLQQEKDNRN
jgi:uncharacterized membrane protein